MDLYDLKKQTAIQMWNDGLSADKISEILKISVEFIERWIQSNQDVRRVNKRWRDVTAEEILKNKKKLCCKCFYFSIRVNGKDAPNLGSGTCDYIGIEHRSRGCSPIGCKKFRSNKITKREKMKSVGMT